MTAAPILVNPERPILSIPVFLRAKTWRCSENFLHLHFGLGGLHMYVVTEECIGCGLCRASCPAGAIAVGSSGHMEIDQEVCIHCGTCCDGCPMEAIEEA